MCSRAGSLPACRASPPRVFNRATSRELVIGMIAGLEGAFVLARAAQSTEALHVAGEMMAQTVQRALDAR